MAAEWKHHGCGNGHCYLLLDGDKWVEPRAMVHETMAGKFQWNMGAGLHGGVYSTLERAQEAGLLAHRNGGRLPEEDRRRLARIEHSAPSTEQA